MDRRDFLRAAGGVLGAVPSLVSTDQALARPKRSKSNYDLNRLPMRDGVRVPTVEEYLAAFRAQKGADNPFEKEVARGKELIKDVPSGPSPYDVAHRFYLWRQGKVGETEQDRKDYRYYAREWPKRGNPIIMGFFDATGERTPAGDTTPWCSAFVSWCIQYTLANHGAGLSADEKEKIWRYEEGAASAAYRSWGDKVSEPRRGDLVVFKRSGWKGHIGFLHKLEKDRIWVLGGNQGAQNDPSGGEVNIASFTGTGDLKLHSFRRASVLHSV